MVFMLVKSAERAHGYSIMAAVGTAMREVLHLCFGILTIRIPY